MSRLVVVSNRVLDLNKATRAGGVAVTLADIVRTHKALWFGLIGEIRPASEADVTKGLPHKFKAFGQLLDKYPQYQREVVLTQIAPPPRESVEAYPDIRHELERLAGSISETSIAHRRFAW